MGGRPGREAGPQPRGHVRRRAGRRQAIDVVFQADLTGAEPTRVLEEWRSAGRKIYPYAEDVVRGVAGRIQAIDQVLGDHLEGWTVPRMAGVDRAILRVAYYELEAGVPAAIAISEAVEAAAELSTEDSGRFVNGILGRIAREIAPDEG